MSQNLPAIKVQCGVPDREAINSFLEELEAVAASCTNILSEPAVNDEGSLKPQIRAANYLDEIAKKYSFAPPRSTFYKGEASTHKQGHETSLDPTLAKTTPHSSLPTKPVVPSCILWQVTRTYKALLSSISTKHRKQ